MYGCGWHGVGRCKEVCEARCERRGAWELGFECGWWIIGGMWRRRRRMEDGIRRNREVARGRCGFARMLDVMSDE